MGWYARERARDRIAELSRRGLELPTFWRESSEAITRAVPHYLSPCWFTLDPASLLVTSHYDNGEIPELPADWLAHEYYGDDFHKIADVARSERGASTLHEATGGDPSRSAGWKLYLQPYGAEQELLVALRTQAGEAWGVLGLYREAGQPQFASDELDFLRELSPYLAEGAQRGLLVGEASDPEAGRPGAGRPQRRLERGVAHPGRRTLAGRTARRRLGDSRQAAAVGACGGGSCTADRPERRCPGEVALARVLSREGRWIVLHGASLVAAGAQRVAVIVEPAHPARLSSLLMAAYRLSEREQDVTRLVLRGNSTLEIADELCVSPHTVQQHLKSVFEKTGVRSRRELVGKVFFAHYEPRVRDNERRVIAGEPVRGGPVPGDAGSARG